MHIPAHARSVNQTGPFVAEPPHDWRFSPGAGLLRLSRHGPIDGRYWWSGDFVDYRGLVTIQRENTFTRLNAVAGAYCHVRTYHKYYGDRTVTQLCRQFLTELYGAPEPA